MQAGAEFLAFNVRIAESERSLLSFPPTPRNDRLHRPSHRRLKRGAAHIHESAFAPAEVRRLSPKLNAVAKRLSTVSK